MFKYCLLCAGNQCLFSQHANITPVKDPHLQDPGPLFQDHLVYQARCSRLWGSLCEEKCGETLGLGLQLSAKVCSVILPSACCCTLFLATIQVGETSLLLLSGAGDFNWRCNRWVRRTVLQVLIFANCFWTQSIRRDLVSKNIVLPMETSCKAGAVIWDLVSVLPHQWKNRHWWTFQFHSRCW